MSGERGVWPGLLLLLGLVGVALFLGADADWRRFGATPLTLAMAFGAAAGNLRPAVAHGLCRPGIRFAQQRLLRLGVVLYGFNLSWQELAGIGLSGIGIDVFMVVTTLGLGVLVGTRCLRMERNAALLIAAGSAICGAAAVVATLPVLRLREAEQARHAATAVATVVLFGTLSMLLYPALFAHLGSATAPFGVYVGSTVHEVAQVVVIGNAIGGDAAKNALIVKMVRVLLLVPFLLLLSVWLRRERGAWSDPRAQGNDAMGRVGDIRVPWFALGFVACAILNSLGVLSNGLRGLAQMSATLCLCLAMAAFGLETTWRLLRQAGRRPLLLGGVLFAYLVGVGGWINLHLAGALLALLAGRV
ncbi:putative sulfate exporter family transporter [Rhodocyclus tenuis]|uniref:Sulfate exporter family transporter n=1 Tax=Rhodocyclus gracilis TaxID=2929842 RepID=A0ABX0WM86_9RHOO|nr:putative sulfate exporter family transporter [Rhodocyclus gracilis]NJA89700.1 putative sulfate exporter family transporter [Rhodocyclus gracilis]